MSKIDDFVKTIPQAQKETKQKEKLKPIFGEVLQRAIALRRESIGRHDR